MGDTAQQTSTKDMLLGMWERINQGRLGDLTDVVDEDVHLEWPQSGEIVHGVSNLRHILGEYPGGSLSPQVETAHVVEGDADKFMLTPMFTTVRVQGSGDHAVGSVRTRYPDGSEWYIVSVATSRDGKLVRILQFFAPVFEAPEWRSRWVEHKED